MLQSTKIVRHSLYCLMGLALSAGAAFGQEYKITLVRPAKVADEYVTTIKSKFSTASPEKTEAFTAELHGTVKVLSVNEKTGLPTKISCTVDKLTKDDKDVYTRGQVITAEKTGAEKTVYTVDDKPAAPDDQLMLDALLDVSSPDMTINDDEIFGTDKSQKVGDTWPADKEKLAKDLSEGFLPLPSEVVQGVSTLVEVKKVKDVDSMVVKCAATATLAKLAIPPGGAIFDGKIDGSQTSTLPVDKSLPATTLATKFTINMTVTPPGAPAPIDVKVSVDKTEEREPVK